LIKKVENASKLEAFSIEINLARGKHGKGVIFYQYSQERFPFQLSKA